jgi:hypothetical protein
VENMDLMLLNYEIKRGILYPPSISKPWDSLISCGVSSTSMSLLMMLVLGLFISHYHVWGEFRDRLFTSKNRYLLNFTYDNVSLVFIKIQS